LKRARILSYGREIDVVVSEPGVLIDAAGHSYLEAEAEFLIPVKPTKVIAISLNYPERAAELELKAPEEPALFFKSPNTWVGHRHPVFYPRGAEHVHYEVELAVVLGVRCRRLKAERVFDHVAGYTIANDLVARDFLTNTYRPPLRAKCWDTSCPIGPYLVAGEIEDPQRLVLKAFVNGEPRQEGQTMRMTRGVAELIEYASSFMTLEPGDVLLTGTPRGPSEIHPGDNLRLEVSGLGALENRIVGEPS
jgi:5-oxopent-3-ene-1,2,5-tricarboxylate decarboxylase/2-hydroxyhepta-2,4-diene-1,7-dioate isomerase